ncbi:MAG: XRE family transcriptional regulator [Novosphingobium sp.]|jgi:repressor LexA|nr:XRE family transcriptional regulator [Novosphingobium sp.]
MAGALSERIRAIRHSKGLDQTQFGEALGVGQSTVARWEKGAQPKPEMLRRMADFVGWAVDDLLGLTDPGSAIAGREVRWVPLIGLAPAGSWREAVALPMGQVTVRADKAGKKAFAVEISGDSMDKLLPEGGWAVIDPDQTDLYENRVYLVINADYDATVKRFRSNPARLEPVSHNPAHETIPITGQISVIGRVVAYGNDEGL